MSILKVNDIEPAVAGGEKFFLSRAWVNFDGTGTVTIRASGNVSSITDFGTGDYMMNFITPIPDAFYAVVGSVSRQDNNSGSLNVSSAVVPTASVVRVRTFVGLSTSFDPPYVSVAIFR